MFFSSTCGERSARSDRNKIGSLLVIQNRKYLIMDAPLQSQAIDAQNRMQVEGCRKDPIPLISCGKKRIDALYMRSQIIGRATNQTVKISDKTFTPLRIGMVLS